MASATFFLYTTLRFLHQVLLFVRLSLLVCTPAKKKPKSQSGNPGKESKRSALILSNLYLLELRNIIILQISLQKSESK